MNLQIVKTAIKNKIVDFIGKTSLPRVQLNQWLKAIDIKTDRVLEVGSSFNPVIGKVKNWEVKEYKTLDNNLEQKCNPDFEIDLNRLDSDNKKAVLNVFKYSPNIIFCLEVMEYIYKPDSVLRFFHDILAKEGILYVSFHTIYPIHKPYKFDSLRYTKWGIINLLKDVGFKKWGITPRNSTMGKDSLLSFYKKEKMWALKNSDLVTDTGYLVKAEK